MVPAITTESELLTPRDREVMNLLANEALTNGQIAERLRISPRTVKQHIRSVKLRIGLGRTHNRVVLANILRAPTAPPDGMRVSFTPIEMLIVRAVVKGLRNRQIAQARGISEQSVKNHLRNVFDKAGVWTRLELANWFASHYGLEQ